MNGPWSWENELAHLVIISARPPGQDGTAVAMFITLLGFVKKQIAQIFPDGIMAGVGGAVFCFFFFPPTAPLPSVRRDRCTLDKAYTQLQFNGTEAQSS